VIEESLMERKKDKADAAPRTDEDEKRRVDEAVEEAK
jgi:small subunit ribosomal protein S2